MLSFYRSELSLIDECFMHGGNKTGLSSYLSLSRIHAKGKKTRKRRDLESETSQNKCYLNLHVTLPNPVQSIVPPNFQNQNENRDAANQSYIFTKFSM